jgi:RPA family protein
MIEISQDKIAGDLFVSESNLNPQEYESDMFKRWVYATKEQALSKWRELNRARKQKVHEVFLEGVLKIGKLLS